MAFIVFEGGDGSGKSTQARVLARRLRRRGYPVLLTHEPGGTPLGEALRRLLKGRSDISPLSELLMFSAARAQLVDKVLLPALQEGVVVICDRFTASTLAYQGYGRGLDLGLIQQLNLTATMGLLPDMTLLLDVPIEQGLARKGSSGVDTFDAAPQEFHQRVKEGYLSQVRDAVSPWEVLDATYPARELGIEIWAKVQPLLLQRG